MFKMNNKKVHKLWICYLYAIISVIVLVASSRWVQAETGNEISPPGVDLHKTISPLLDQSGQPIPGKHELSLDISAKKGQQVETTPLDVILVADLSGSMRQQDVVSRNGSNISRIEALKNTLKGDQSRKGLIDTILSNSNNRLSIVGFAGKIDNRYNNYYYSWPNFAGYYDGIKATDDAEQLLSWENNSQQAKNTVNNISISNSPNSWGTETGIGTGTNIEAGLRKASEVLKTSRPNAKKIIMLLSDGEANMYYDTNGYTIYNYSSDSRVSATTPTPKQYATNLDTTMNNAASYLAPQVDGFYSIKFRYVGTKDSITALKGYVSSYNANIPNEVYSANDEANLGNQFDAITKKILPLGIRKVTITDELSKFVALTPEDAGNIRVVAISEDGSEHELNEQEVTIKREADSSGLMKVIAEFNPDYSLDEGTRYILKFTVNETQGAADAIAGDSSLANDEAENGDRTKLYSNRNAYITYTYGIKNPQEKTEYYQQKPVFKATEPNSTPVKVEWRGVGGKAEDPVTAPRPKTVVVKLVQKGKDGAKDKSEYRKATVQVANGAAVFASVARGYDYTVTAPNQTGFTQEVTKEGDGFKIVYRQLPSLEITKEVQAETASSNKEYKILIDNAWAPKPDNPREAAYLEGTYGGIVFHGGKAEIKLKAGQSLTLPYLPRQMHYKLTEDTQSAKGYEVSYEHREQYVNEADVHAKVINHKLPVLSIKKEIKGPFANLLQEFKIKVRVLDSAAPISGTYHARIGDEGKEINFKDGWAEFSLKRNQTLTIENLPLHGKYTVLEDKNSSQGYQVTYQNQSGKLDADVLSVVTNSKYNVPETGIGLLATPATLIVVLSFSGAGLVFLLIQTVRRRRR